MPAHHDEPRLVVDAITGVEVVYAPKRAERSNAFTSEPLQLPTTERCPFCPGNEDETPPSAQVWPTNIDDTSWQVRAVPNRFPAVAMQADATGRHEVLIESRDHQANWLTMSSTELALVFQAVRDRIQDMQADQHLRCLQVFKNVGRRARASLAHPHLQVIGLGFVPTLVAATRDRAHSFALKHGHDYQTSLIEQAMQQPTTVVHADADYLTLCPPASRVPYEMWVLPRHSTAYTSQTAEKLSQHVKQSLQLLTAATGDVAHNIVWQLPTREEPTHRWRLEIIPRLTTFAGLEFGSGLYINPVPPEVAAQRLSESGSLTGHG